MRQHRLRAPTGSCGCSIHSDNDNDDDDSSAVSLCKCRTPNPIASLSYSSGTGCLDNAPPSTIRGRLNHLHMHIRPRLTTFHVRTCTRASSGAPSAQPICPPMYLLTSIHVYERVGCCTAHPSALHHLALQPVQRGASSASVLLHTSDCPRFVMFLANRHVLLVGLV